MQTSRYRNFELLPDFPRAQLVVWGAVFLRVSPRVQALQDDRLVPGEEAGPLRG